MRHLGTLHCGISDGSHEREEGWSSNQGLPVSEVLQDAPKVQIRYVPRRKAYMPAPLTNHQHKAASRVV